MLLNNNFIIFNFLLGMDKTVTFLVKYGISRKIVKCQLLHIVDEIRSAFKFKFSKSMRIQFIHEEFNEYVDLDTPSQLLQRANNNLQIINIPDGSSSDSDSESQSSK